MVTMTASGRGFAVEREVSESTALEIMELAIDDEIEDGKAGVTVSLSGEGMDFDRDVSETTAVGAVDAAVRGDSHADPDSEGADDDGLPGDFFDRLSRKQRVMLEILLEADGEWMRGTDIRQQMREEYDMDVGEGGRATAGVIAGLTRKYDEELRRAVIPGRWADETQQHAEFRIGETYEDEIREWFER